MRAMDVARLAGAIFAVTAAYAADAPQPVHRPIYRCELNGVITFSDRACGDTIEVYKLEFDNAEHARAPEKAPAKPRLMAAQPTVRKVAEPKQTASHQEACERMDDSARKIRSQMRAGYDAKEGNRLRERLAQVQERRRAQKCR
jgi:hypothetical protein